MEDKKRLDLLKEIKRKYLNGSPPKMSKYNVKKTGCVYISDEELNDLLGAKLVETIPFIEYTKIKLTEKGKNLIYSERKLIL